MRTWCAAGVLIVTATLVPGCGGEPPSNVDVPAPVATEQPSLSRPRVVVLGDSLTAGLGLAPEDAYPRLLEERLNADGLGFEVVNAGVSGETSAGGLRRVAWSLAGDVRVLVVALGGNDGLRGVPAAELRRNLAGIIEQAQARGIAVVLAGMEAPPNFGDAYTREFRAVYTDLATAYRVPLIPFLLQSVAGVDALNQPDGIHPTAAGAQRIADTVWPVLRDVVKEQSQRTGRQSSPSS